MNARLRFHDKHLRPLRRASWSTLLAAVLTIAVYRRGEAHTTLLASDPAAGSQLSASPSRVRLLFSEPIEPELATVSVSGSTGERRVLTAAGDPHDVHAILAPLDSLASGSYRVAWHVVSADGHPVGGSYTFSVGMGVGGAPPPAAPASDTSETAEGVTVGGAPVIAALLRGAAVGCMMGLCGLLLFIAWFRASLAARAARIARGFAIAAPVLFAAHFVAWLANASPTHSVSAEWFSLAVTSTAGRAELWRTLLAIPPLWALLLVRRPALAFVLAAIAVVMSAAVGHSAVVHPMLSIPFKAIHLLGAAAWMGGLLWLVVRDPGDAASVATDAFRVSAVSLAGVAAVILSGVIQTAVLLPSLHDLASSYGAIVGAKVLGLAVLLAFGAHHRYRVLPRMHANAAALHPSPSFRASLSRELAVFAIVVMLGGVLAYVSPPHPESAHQPAHTDSTQ
jgi:copper transport protein